MEGISIALLIPIIAILVLGIVVFQKNTHNRTFQIFLLMCIAQTFWGIVSLVYLDFQILVAARLSFALGIAIAVTLFLFSLHYPSPQPLSSPWYLVIWILAAILGTASLTPLVLKTFPQISYGVLVIPYIIYFLGMFSGSLYNFYRKYRKAQGIQRQQIMYVLISCFIAVFWGLIFDLLIPVAIGSITYNRIGLLMISIMTIGITYSILRLRLFNITIQLQKVINSTFPIIISTCIVVPLGVFLFMNKQIGIAALIIGAIILYALLHRLLSYFFLKSNLNHFLFRKTYRYHHSLISFANQASGITDFNELLKKMQQVFLGDGFVEAFAFFVITNQETKACHVLETHNINLKELIMCSDSILHPFLHQELSKNKEPMVIEELAYHPKPEYRELQKVFYPLDGGVCIPLFVSNDLAGIILLGSKLYHFAYTNEDIEVFKQISIPLAVAVTKAALFTHYQERVTELTRDKKNLETSMSELSNSKSEFLTIVNHQLNTPLSVMRSVMSMIKDGDVPLSEVQEYVKEIDPKMESFAHIVQDMLDAAEFEGTGATLKFQATDLNTTIKTALTTLQTLIEQSKVTIQLQLGDDLPRVLTDPEKFSKALNQLIKNALIYGREKLVVITTKQKEDRILITIQDNGRGFDKEETEKIGTKFFRGKKVADYLADGSGLGVYTAKKIIEASGGALMWSSDGIGKGSTFMITLPKAMEFVKTVAMK